MPPRDRTFTVTSVVAAPPQEVWDRISTMDGVNDELGPWFRMTHPPHLTRLTPEAVPLGRKAFRSWIRLGGVLPVDFDDLTIVRLDPGRGFLERSTMLSQALWEHERTLEAHGPDGSRTQVTDRLVHRPRLPVAGQAQTALFRQVFRHRHRRLARRFGAA